MANNPFYPPADTSTQWFGDNFVGSVIDPDKMVWHTTETTGWPGYSSGASAPHLTYNPKTRAWRQHFRLDRSARALRNEAGGIETNTDHCAQVEIICYSDDNLAETVSGGLWVANLSEGALEDLGKFSEWLEREWNVALHIDSNWVRSSYRNPSRMSFTTWQEFKGHTGHNRVPENTHWDPGALDIDSIIAYAKGEDMALTDEDKVWLKDMVDKATDQAIGEVKPWQSPSVKEWAETVNNWGPISLRRAMEYTLKAAHVNGDVAPGLNAKLNDIDGKLEAATGIDIQALAAAIVGQLGQELSTLTVEDVELAVAKVLGQTSYTTTPVPPSA